MLMTMIMLMLMLMTMIILIKNWRDIVLYNDDVGFAPIQSDFNYFILFFIGISINIEINSKFQIPNSKQPIYEP